MRRIIYWFRQIGITKTNLRWLYMRRIVYDWFLRTYLTEQQRRRLFGSWDPVRYGTFLLSFEQISKEGIVGSLAECGVYKGETSKFIHEIFPERKLFLFDTFQGFDPRDSESSNDMRFRDTSEQGVLHNIGDIENVIIRKGYFPETAVGLENERFALVLIDFDKYESTLSALKFFYPLVNRGGFIFVHDYSNPESNWACSRALNEFLSDKSEKPILIPDAWGTAILRKV